MNVLILSQLQTSIDCVELWYGYTRTQANSTIRLCPYHKLTSNNNFTLPLKKNPLTHTNKTLSDIFFCFFSQIFPQKSQCRTLICITYQSLFCFLFDICLTKGWRMACDVWLCEMIDNQDIFLGMLNTESKSMKQLEITISISWTINT